MRIERSSPLRDPRVPGGDESNLIALINVVFLVLVFLLMAGTIAPVDVLRISPPVSGASVDRDPSALTFTITADGTLWWQDQPVVADRLVAVLAGLQAHNDSDSVVVEIRADRTTPSGVLQDLLTALQAAGFQEVRLLTAARTS